MIQSYAFKWIQTGWNHQLGQTLASQCHKEQRGNYTLLAESVQVGQWWNEAWPNHSLHQLGWVVATQVCFFLNPENWGNDPIWRAYFFTWVETTN